jgi:hypothetical protein
MPWHDWQFWLVTALAAFGSWRMVRLIVPNRKAGAGSCPSCTSSSPTNASRRKVTLTIDRQQAGRSDR